MDATTVCGMEVYVDEDLAPGEPEIASPEEVLRRYGTRWRRMERGILRGEGLPVRIA
jgi:hypothetical protein